ncbi:hypothetical protein XI02_22390 [Bradyrhizobium sp. CCBAU 21365]|nr:hypothetical protein XI02_22390 [Bradyrhizobium sp. CCBAU 21365]
MPGAAASADALCFKTDVSPEELFLAIGRLRREARDEVDRLLNFLDKTDDYVSRELEDDGEENEEGGDVEPSLGSLDRAPNQERWAKGVHPWDQGDVDRELDRSDDEPSLAATETHVCVPHPVMRTDDPMGGRRYRDCSASQEFWAASSTDEREHDDDNGVGDIDGLLEQVGTSYGGGMT